MFARPKSSSSAGNGPPTLPAAAREPSSSRRGAARSETAPVPRLQSHPRSQRLDLIGNFIKGGGTVDLVPGRIEPGIGLGKIGSDDGLGGHHPDADAFL